jgi:predicted  nucleic acid-binding Zn-ribbon protein
VIDMVQVLESEIRDLQRIIDADEQLLHDEQVQEKRQSLLAEIGQLEEKIEKLKRNVEAYRHPY